MDRKQMILDEIRELMQDQVEVDLMSFYQKLPLTYRGVIHEVGLEDVTLLVQPPDSVCLTWDSTVYLLAPEPVDLLKADVASFDIVTGMVKLNNVSFAGSTLGKRMITRLTPGAPLKVDVKVGEATFSSVMLDISSQGIGIAQAGVSREEALRKGNKVEVVMHFPDEQVQAKGVVQAVVQSGDEQHISLVFDEEETDIRPVWRFISQRRMEILQELQEKYLAAYLQGLNDQE